MVTAMTDTSVFTELQLQFLNKQQKQKKRNLSNCPHNNEPGYMYSYREVATVRHGV